MSNEFWVRSADLARLFEAKAICFIVTDGVGEAAKGRESIAWLGAAAERMGFLRQLFLMVPLVDWRDRERHDAWYREVLAPWGCGCYLYLRSPEGGPDVAINAPECTHVRLEHPPAAHSRLLLWGAERAGPADSGKAAGMVSALEAWLSSNRSGSEVAIPKLAFGPPDPLAEGRADVDRLFQWLAAGYVADLEERHRSTAAILTETMRQLSDIQCEYERMLNVFDRYPPEELMRLRSEAELLRSEAEQRRATLRYQIADRIFHGLAGNRSARWIGKSAAHLLWRVLGR
jgi:hypothetical protein